MDLDDYIQSDTLIPDPVAHVFRAFNVDHRQEYLEAYEGTGPAIIPHMGDLEYDRCTVAPFRHDDGLFTVGTWCYELKVTEGEVKILRYDYGNIEDHWEAMPFWSCTVGKDDEDTFWNATREDESWEAYREQHLRQGSDPLNLADFDPDHDWDL